MNSELWLTPEEVEYLTEVLINDAASNCNNAAFQQEYQHAKNILIHIHEAKPTEYVSLTYDERVALATALNIEQPHPVQLDQRK